MDPVNLADFEALARAKLSALAADYYASGANDEITLRENRAAYDRIALAYRVLVDVHARDLATSVLGQRVAMPILVAPTAFQRLAHDDGELATARAASAAGSIMILSSLANTSIEDVAAVCTAPLWFQLYVYKDRAITEGVVARAEAAGCRALVLTVDAPLLGRRERDIKNRFALPPGLTVKNVVPHGVGEVPAALTGSGLTAYVRDILDPSLTWKDVAWLRSITRLPIVLKGIVRPDDARRAVDHGASAVVVSNHGGRQLDTSPATIDALARIAPAVNGAIELYVDGGVRRGTDVVKALARGAKAVLVGRPILWGLAAGGESGARAVLELLKDELDLAMALCGCPTIADVTADLLA